MDVIRHVHWSLDSNQSCVLIQQKITEFPADTSSGQYPSDVLNFPEGRTCANRTQMVNNPEMTAGFIQQAVAYDSGDCHVVDIKLNIQSLMTKPSCHLQRATFFCIVLYRWQCRALELTAISVLFMAGLHHAQAASA